MTDEEKAEQSSNEEQPRSSLRRLSAVVPVAVDRFNNRLFGLDGDIVFDVDCSSVHNRLVLGVCCFEWGGVAFKSVDSVIFNCFWFDIG